MGVERDDRKSSLRRDGEEVGVKVDDSSRLRPETSKVR